jgi:hypothetical protein
VFLRLSGLYRRWVNGTDQGNEQCHLQEPLDNIGEETIATIEVCSTIDRFTGVSRCV